MTMFAKMMRPFRPLDTSHVEAALDDARQSQRAVAVRARALRMDISCGDPAEAIRQVARLVRSRSSNLLHHYFDSAAEAPVPPDLQALLDKL